MRGKTIIRNVVNFQFSLGELSAIQEVNLVAANEVVIELLNVFHRRLHHIFVYDDYFLALVSQLVLYRKV